MSEFKKLLLILLTGFLIYYSLVAGTNLILRLTAANQPTCNPLFCKEIASEASYCLIQTPGSQECLKISGYFFVVSKTLAFLLIVLSLGVAYYISKKFYLVRILIPLGILAAIIFITRVFIGAVNFTADGGLSEFEKIGLAQIFL